MKRFLVVLLALVALGSLLGNLLLYRRYSTNRPVVSMKGGGITVKDYRDRLEYLHGREILTKMVLSKIVLDAAQKGNVAPTDQDIDRRIEFIRRRNPNQLQNADLNPMAMSEIRENLRSDIALENLTTKNIEVSSKEVDSFYSKYGNLVAAPEQYAMTTVIASNDTDAHTASELLKKKIDAATIAQQPRLMVVGLNTGQPNMSVAQQNAMASRVHATPVGGVLQMEIPATGGKQFLIIRVDTKNPKGIEPLSKVRSEVERFCRLAKAQRQGRSAGSTMLAAYKAAGVRFDSERYAQYLSRISEAAQNADTKAALAKP